MPRSGVITVQMSTKTVQTTSSTSRKKYTGDIDPRVLEEENALLEVEKDVCSYGDTVHYAEQPQFFATCDGSYLYDGHGKAFLDLQMWYSAVNLGYANQRVSNALK